MSRKRSEIVSVSCRRLCEAAPHRIPGVCVVVKPGLSLVPNHNGRKKDVTVRLVLYRVQAIPVLLSDSDASGRVGTLEFGIDQFSQGSPCVKIPFVGQ